MLFEKLRVSENNGKNERQPSDPLFQHCEALYFCFLLTPKITPQTAHYKKQNLVTKH